MTAESAPPSVFSLEFHLRFLPAVIRGRLRPQARGTAFLSGTIEMNLLLAVSGILLAIGIPGVAGDAPSLVSLVLTLLGTSGLLALVAFSIYMQWNVPTTYELFEPAVFFFFIVLGITAGLWTAELTDPDRFAGTMFREPHNLQKGLWSLGGLAAGYVVGILAGLWIQVLGPIRTPITVLAWPGMIGLVVADLVLLSLD